MADKYVDKHGHKHGAKSASGIKNAEHHDKSGSKKTIDVIPGTIKEIVSDSTVETPVEDRVLVRAFNTGLAVAYLWIGEAGSAPVTVDATNGIALGPESGEIIATGHLVSGKSVAIKASVSGVQVIIFE